MGMGDMFRNALGLTRTKRIRKRPQKQEKQLTLVDFDYEGARAAREEACQDARTALDHLIEAHQADTLKVASGGE